MYPATDPSMPTQQMEAPATEMATDHNKNTVEEAGGHLTHDDIQIMLSIK